MENKVQNLMAQIEHLNKENGTLRLRAEVLRNELQKNKSSSLETKNFLNLQPVGKIIPCVLETENNNYSHFHNVGNTARTLYLTESYSKTFNRELSQLQKYDYLWIVFPCLNFKVIDSVSDGASFLRTRMLPDSLKFSPIDLRLIRVVKYESNSIQFKGMDVPDFTPVFDVIPFDSGCHSIMAVEKKSTLGEKIVSTKRKAEKMDDSIASENKDNKNNSNFTKNLDNGVNFYGKNKHFSDQSKFADRLNQFILNKNQHYDVNESNKHDSGTDSSDKSSDSDESSKFSIENLITSVAMEFPHSPSNIQTFKCLVCNNQFTSDKDKIERHKRSCWRKYKESENIYFASVEVGNSNRHRIVQNRKYLVKKHEDLELHCHYCLKTFTKKRNLSAHIINVHGDESCERINGTIKKLERENNDLPVQCDYCRRIFQRKSSLRVHITMTHFALVEKIRKYKCDICKRKFTSIAHLNRHYTSKIHVKNREIALLF